MICANCQKENPAEAKFCVKCGKNLASINKAQQISAVKSERAESSSLCKGCGRTIAPGGSNYLCPSCAKKKEEEKKEIEYKRLFIGEKADYYLSKWGDDEKWYSKYGNRGALIGGIFWYAYRKMYLRALIYVLMFMLLVLIVSMTGIHSGLFTIPIAILLTIPANRLYANHTEKKIANLKRKYSNTDVLKQKIKKVGGTSLISAIGFVFIIFLMIAISTQVPVWRQKAYAQEYKQSIEAAFKSEDKAIQNLNSLISSFATATSIDATATAQRLDSDVIAKYEDIKNWLFSKLMTRF